MKTIYIVILIAFTTSVFAQDIEKGGIVFPISSGTKYKDFVSYMVVRSHLRFTAKIIYEEKVINQDKITENECVLLFDKGDFLHRRYNLLKKQDSIQYISDGYLLYTIFHKTKEVIIIDSVLEKESELMRNNPFVFFYTFAATLSSRKKSNVSMFSNNEFVVINYPEKMSKLYRDGVYSSKFRACDFALSEQNCFLINENNVADLYAATLISLEDENKFNFTEKDFDASQWLDSYTVIDKRSQNAMK